MGVEAWEIPIGWALFYFGWYTIGGMIYCGAVTLFVGALTLGWRIIYWSSNPFSAR